MIDDHTWDEGQTLLAANCIHEGMVKYTCSVCSDTKIETLERGATDLKGEFRAQKDEFRQDLREINSKLDRLIEAQGRRK